MKFVCAVLLVICTLQAVQSHDVFATKQHEKIANYRLPQQREGEGLIEFIANIAKQTIQLAKDAIKVLQSRIDQLIQDIRDRLFGVQQIGDDALDAILKDIEKLVSTRSTISACVQNHMDEIKQVISNGREDVTKCILTAMNEGEAVNESLQPYVESIAALIKNVSGIVEKCSSSSNPISVAFCITQHVTDVSSAISKIISESQEAIRMAIVQINALVRDTQKCVKTATDAARAAVEQIIMECKSESVSG